MQSRYQGHVLDTPHRKTPHSCDKPKWNNDTNLRVSKPS